MGRDEWVRRMEEWFERTEPEERGAVGAVVLLGVVAVPVQVGSLGVLGVVLVRRMKGRRSGRGLVAGVVGLQVGLQGVRWVLMRRLRRALEGGEG